MSSPRKKIRKNRQSTSFFSIAEDNEMTRFWVEYVSRDYKKEPIRQIWHKFIAQSQSERSISSLTSRFRVHVAPKIWKMINLDLDTIVKVLFISRSHVEEEYLKELRNMATVQVDEKNLILKFQDPRPNGLNLIYDPPYQLKSLQNRHAKSEPTESSDSEDDVEVDGPVPMPIPMGQIKWEQEPDEMDSESYLTEAWHRNQRNSGDGFRRRSDEMMASREMVMFATSLKGMFDSQAEMMRELVKGTEKKPPAPSAPAAPRAPSSFSAFYCATSSSFNSPPTSNSSTVPPSTSSINTSKKGFLFLLRSLVLGMDRPDFEPIRRRISREIQKIGDGDENLPVNSIKMALESVLDIVK